MNDKLIDMQALLLTERHNLKELIILTKSDKCDMNLGVLHRDMYHVFKAEPLGVDEWAISEYDRFNDQTFKGFSYLELSSVESLGANGFAKSVVAPVCSAVSHHIALKSKTDLNTNMTVTSINRLSLAVKETYSLLDSHVVAICIFKTDEA